MSRGGVRAGLPKPPGGTANTATDWQVFPGRTARSPSAPRPGPPVV